jgi:hypothetical protein
MKTLYLHIGTPKTASTAIQKFCRNNRILLAQKNFYYPKSLYKYPKIGFHRNAHFIFGKIHDEEGHRLKEQEDALFEKGLSQISQSFAKYDNVILSDEGLWYASGYIKKKTWNRLKNHAKKYGYTIRLIVYLRRQDQYLMSRWNQRIKQNTTRASWEDELAHIMEKQRFMLQYGERIDALAALFGKENIIVRRFDRDSFPNGNIIADFLQILGLELTDEYKIAEKDNNTALKGNAVEIKRILNNVSYLERRELSHFGRILKDCSTETDNSCRYQMMSPDETKVFLSQFQEENDRVAREYIGDGKPLFDNNISSLPKWEHNNPALMDDVIRFIAASHTYMYREISRMNETLAKISDEHTHTNTELPRVNVELDKRKNEVKDLKHKLKHPVSTVLQKKGLPH